MAFSIACPRLTPLQSRVAASSFATVLVIALWVLWTLPSTAYSQSLPDIRSSHRLHHLHSPSHYSRDDHHSEGEYPAQGDRPASFDEVVDEYYNPLFQSNSHIQRSPAWPSDPQAEEDSSHDLLPGLLSKRQTSFVLVGDRRSNLNIEPGEIQVWGFETEQIFADAGKPGAANVFVDEENGVRMRTVYFGFNTCFQPSPSNTTTNLPPPLVLYASNSSSNKAPGPNSDPRRTITFPVVEGFANVTLNASATIYLSVVAPNITDEMGNFTGIYNYNLIASTKQPYYGYFKPQNLYLIDSDSTNALLISGNETSYGKNVNISSIDPPYTFFAHPANSTSLNGLRRSVCGLASKAQLQPNSGDISMTRRGLGNKVKEQIYLKGLAPNTTYNVWLAKANNESIGGGWVYSAVNLTTKSDGNCRVIYDLGFCSEVAYAVPTNNTLFESMSRLASFYDTYASSWYANFSYSLQQVQCNTTSDREYSHLRSCEDCDKAYKNWLCATTIPRCADYTSNATFLAVRERVGEDMGPTKVFLEDGRIIDIPNPNGTANGTNGESAGSGDTRFRAASRNVLIDEVVSPGPYKEIKPCMDLCWSLVQSCPASLGFSCPDGARGDLAYGWRSDDGDITCSYLGAAYFLSESIRSRVVFGGGGVVGWWVLVVAGVMVGMAGL
ncbi:hypothetical protein ABW19_dt0206328 [Dactylella cylindrospora]|nr:hypothetical protein ABW19_dt0206328 [Dactylella cylindrospora]